MKKLQKVITVMLVASLLVLCVACGRNDSNCDANDMADTITGENTDTNGNNNSGNSTNGNSANGNNTNNNSGDSLLEDAGDAVGDVVDGATDMVDDVTDGVDNATEDMVGGGDTRRR